MSFYPNFEVKVYGSFATGLAMPWSDIDMVIDIDKFMVNNPGINNDIIMVNLKKVFDVS